MKTFVIYGSVFVASFVLWLTVLWAIRRANRPKLCPLCKGPMDLNERSHNGYSMVWLCSARPACKGRTDV